MGDIWLWLTGALLVSVCAVCGTMLICTKMRCKALENYNFRKEHAYQQIAAERDAWRDAYEYEHGERVSCQSLLRVQTLILRKIKVLPGGKKA